MARRALGATAIAVFILVCVIYCFTTGDRKTPLVVPQSASGGTFAASSTPAELTDSLTVGVDAFERDFIARDQFRKRLAVLKSEVVSGLRSEAQLVSAVSAMIDETNDKHAELATVEEYETWLARREGKVVGIDFDYEQNQDGRVFVTKVQSNGSAEKAGVKPGDELVNIDEYHVDELKKAGGAARAIGVLANYGVIGSTIDMRFKRGDVYMNFEIERVVLKTESALKADVEKRSNDSEPLVAGMQLAFLEANDVVEQVIAELEKVNKDGVKGLVLGLESLAGGNGEKALRIAALFIENGVLAHVIEPVGVEEVEMKSYYVQNGKVFVSTKGPFTRRADGKLDTGKTAPPTVTPLDWKANVFAGELVVCVNRQTAGCAELITSALKGNRRATVVGARTAGKGLGQTIYRLSAKYVLVFSTSSWLGPDGWAIEDISITPNVPLDPRFGSATQAALQVLHQKLRLVPFPVLPPEAQ